MKVLPKQYLGTKLMDIYKNEHIACSVIIPSYNSARTIRDCLDSVLGQQTDLAYEVLVADSSSDGTFHIIRHRYPVVRLIRFARQTDPGTARNAAVQQARGEIILFTDSDCIVSPHWLEQMVHAHRDLPGCRVVGGAVVNGNPETLASVAGYLIEFSEYMPSAPGGVVSSLPTCNISYRREIFDVYGGYEGKYYPQEDYLFHWHLVQGGEQIYFCPAIQVRHFHRSSISGYLQHNYRFGTVTARVLKLTDMPGAFFGRRPWLAPLFLPFLPFIKFVRTTLRVLRLAPATWRRPMVFPVMLLGLLSWGIGFVWGIYGPCSDVLQSSVSS